MIAPPPADPRRAGPLRLVVLVAIGLGALNVAQYVAGAMNQCVADDELRAERAKLATATAPQETIDRCHQIFYKNPGGISRNRWFGIRAEQNPNDVWITQEILFETKPDVVVEAGTFMGGSAALWATMLREINPQGRVLTIDIRDLSAEAKKLPIVQERVDFLVGSSIAPEIVAEVKRRTAGKKVVLILDSDHHKAHVLAELRAYADIIQPGSYIIVQDSNINGHPVVLDDGYLAGDYLGQPGPWEAVEEFLATDHRFQIDLGRERLLLTMNPHGFLRRVD